MASDFRHFVATVVAGDTAAAIALLDRFPQIARERAAVGATRAASKDAFFDRIAHYMYEGDSALHMAAASYQPIVVEKLLSLGADVHARNRRGALPLHYAVDGGPGLPAWDPDMQSRIVTMLIRAGADPSSADGSGVAPLHRAVRNRCAAAVAALISGGADPTAPNRSGSTPMKLAALATGRGGSGSAEAKAQQAEIVALLQRYEPT